MGSARERGRGQPLAHGQPPSHGYGQVPVVVPATQRPRGQIVYGEFGQTAFGHAQVLMRLETQHSS
jgi:hypothetical protein